MPPPSIIRTHGGKLWDTLFLLLKDNDKDFIIDYIKRLPCEKCVEDTMDKLQSIDLDNKSKEEYYKILWDLRRDLYNKYIDKDLDGYLKYLMLSK